MHSVLKNLAENQLNCTKLLLRLVLYKDEVLRLPEGCKEIRILSGNAWVTINGEDITIFQGEKRAITPHKDMVLVSTLRDTPLVFEAWGDGDSTLDCLQLSAANV